MKFFPSILIISSLAISNVFAQGGLSTIGRIFEFKRSGQPYYLQMSAVEVADVASDVTDLAAVDVNYQMYPEPALRGVIDVLSAEFAFTNGLPPAGGLAGIEDFFTDGADSFAAFYDGSFNPDAFGAELQFLFPQGTPPAAAFPSLVFYPVGESRNAAKRHVLRASYVVKLKKSFSSTEQVGQFIARQGIESFTNAYPSEGVLICEAAHSYDALQRIFSVAKDAAVEVVEPLFIRELSKRAVPLDAYYAYDPTKIGYQWGLNNTGENQGVAGVDIKLEAALDLVKADGSPISGLTAPLMIVDDGIFYDHPDLLGSGIPILGNNFNGVGLDSSSQNPTDTHGTMMVGIISAARDELGITGITQGGFASVRLTAGPVDDSLIAAALDYENPGTDSGFREIKGISVNGWGPSDLETDMVAASTLVRTAIEKESKAISSDVEGTGTIYVWAAGNGSEVGDDSNYDGFANLPETIAVGGITDQGRKAAYSEKGANLVVSGPSSGGAQGVLTTAVEADAEAIDGLTNDFGGTSAASAVVAGVVSLMMDANPNLGWRDIQEILIETATQNDQNGGDWVTNGAGYTFNHSYGSGLVNAEAAVSAAIARGADILAERDEPLNLNQTPIAGIPDNNGNSLILNFDLSQAPNRRIEHVQLRMKISTERRADLDIVLVSPNGTQSILARSHSGSDEVGITNWTFSTVRTWGEGSQGVWVLRLTDKVTGNLAVLNNAQLIIHGVDDPAAPIQPAPLLVSDQVVNAIQGVPLSYSFEVLGATSVTIENIPAGLTYNGSSKISGAPTVPGVFVTDVTLTGPLGTKVFPITFIISPVALSLGEAVEQDSRSTTSGGQAPWNFEFGDTSDGIDAVASASNLPADSESRFGFANLPEMVLVSQWKVSSQDGADRLWINDGGAVPYQWYAFIDGGRISWAPIAVRLPATSNRVDWTFSRDADDLDVDGFTQETGSSQGFVDQVKLVDIKSFNDDVESAANLDPLSFNYEQTGKTLFLPVADPTASDGMAIRSSAIGDGQTVALAGWVNGPVTVSFDFRTDTVLGDGMEYLVGSLIKNGSLAIPVIGTGSQGWTNVTDVLPEGRHYVQIRFRKDFSGESVGEDAVWLDNISVTQQSNFLSSGYSDPDLDSDGDGYSNLLEYAFGGDAAVAEVPRYAPQLVSAFGTTWIEFGIDGSKSDLEMVAEESTDMVTWTKTSYAFPERKEGSKQVYRIPIFEDPTAPKRFYRVDVKLK